MFLLRQVTLPKSISCGKTHRPRIAHNEVDLAGAVRVHPVDVVALTDLTPREDDLGSVERPGGRATDYLALELVSLVSLEPNLSIT